jgi:hypothetical protein
MTNQKIITLLREFSEIQGNLISEFLNINTQIRDNFSLSKTQRKGSIFLLEKEWSFQIHGVGICFVEKNTGLTIDIHKAMFQYQKAFDSWRLAEYFESQKINYIYYESNKYDLREDDDIQEILTDLEKNKVIKSVPKEKKLYTLES